MKYQGLVHFDPKKELLYFVPRNVLGFFLFQTYFFFNLILQHWIYWVLDFIIYFDLLFIEYSGIMTWVASFAG
jgi:hypothetical protein